MNAAPARGPATRPAPCWLGGECALPTAGAYATCSPREGSLSVQGQKVSTLSPWGRGARRGAAPAAPPAPHGPRRHGRLTLFSRPSMTSIPLWLRYSSRRFTRLCSPSIFVRRLLCRRERDSRLAGGAGRRRVRMTDCLRMSQLPPRHEACHTGPRPHDTHHVPPPESGSPAGFRQKRSREPRKFRCRRTPNGGRMPCTDREGLCPPPGQALCPTPTRDVY